MCDCSELAFASHQLSGEHHGSYNLRERLLYVRCRDCARLTDVRAYLCSMLPSLRETKTGPSRSHPVLGTIGPDRLHTLACGSAYTPTTRTVRRQRAAPAIPRPPPELQQPCNSSSPAGVTAESTAVEEPQQ